MTFGPTCLLFILAGIVPLTGAADVQSELMQANQILSDAMPKAQALAMDGKVDEANKMILDTFPEKTRTPVQTFMLANVFFLMDPKLAYDLHKQAAKDLPDLPEAQFEWAMDQHRAGEFAGAAASYALYLKAHPEAAPAWGLDAECLLRTGQVREAVLAWLQSEAAKGGSLETLESWDCEVHTHNLPLLERILAFSKAKTGDLDAAQKAVVLDADFRPDWWNQGPRGDLLKQDVDMLAQTKFSDAERVSEISAVAECYALDDISADKVKEVLGKHGFLFDDKGTLPKDNAMFSYMVDAALTGKTISTKDARDKWGAVILERAKAGHDAELYDTARFLYKDTDQMPAIEQEAWDVTGQDRFAAGLLLGLFEKKDLKLDDPRLIKAYAQFPENAEIAGVYYQLTHDAGKPEDAALIQAIKAEYSHFSDNMIGRPAANALRGYFLRLAEVMKIEIPKPTTAN